MLRVRSTSNEFPYRGCAPGSADIIRLHATGQRTLHNKRCCNSWARRLDRSVIILGELHPYAPSNVVVWHELDMHQAASSARCRDQRSYIALLRPNSLASLAAIALR